jgi:hypothetical protein
MGGDDNNVLHLVPPSTAQAEMVAALETLLRQAKDGDLIGIAAALLYRNGHSGKIVGEAWEHPTFVRGMLCNLDDQLADVVQFQPRAPVQRL